LVSSSPFSITNTTLNIYLLYTNKQREPALSLGVAFQLTNILRDVGEDADRGRIYLPQEDLDKFGITEEDIFKKNFTLQYQQIMKYQIARARRNFVRAKRGVAMLRDKSRWPVQSSLDCYSQILDKIEDSFTAVERGNVKFEYCRRKAVWYIMVNLVNAGFTKVSEIYKIRQAYVGRLSVLVIISKLQKEKENGGHPNLFLLLIID
jgi:phytoene/squalene synthetase